MEGIQLNRFVAAGGICSRRKAVEHIAAGYITVNGTPQKDPGYRVQKTDSVRYHGTTIAQAQPVYLLLHKPLGVVSTCSDEQGRPTVLDICKHSIPRETRLFPVGRLDADSTGLILLTNDGTLLQTTAHPRAKMIKRYSVKLHEPVCSTYLNVLCKGIYLKDGYASVDRIFYTSRDRRTVEVWIHSGRNRILRRLFAHGGYHVHRLHRIAYGPLEDRRLKAGACRFLTAKEIQCLLNPVSKAGNN